MIRVTINSDKVAEGKTTVGELLAHMLRLFGIDANFADPDGSHQVVQLHLGECLAALREKATFVQISEQFGCRPPKPDWRVDIRAQPINRTLTPRGPGVVKAVMADGWCGIKCPAGVLVIRLDSGETIADEASKWMTA